MPNVKTKECRSMVPGGAVYVKQWIPETTVSKPPILLLHDSLGSVDAWKEFPQMLAEYLSQTVIAYDRLGFGKSDARDTVPSASFVEEEATRYFPAIKQQLSLRHYVLFGYSVGGSMAINIAASDADCVAVITMAAQAFVEDRTFNAIAEAGKSFAQPGQIERLQKWHGDKARWVLDAWTEVWLSSEFARWNLLTALENLHCPILAIHGEADEYGSLAFPRMIVEKSAGHSEMLILKKCGHAPHKDYPQEVLHAVSEFLAKHS